MTVSGPREIHQAGGMIEVIERAGTAGAAGPAQARPDFGRAGYFFAGVRATAASVVNTRNVIVS